MRDFDSGPLYDPLQDSWNGEPGQQPTFRHSASLRIFGESLDFLEIERALAIVASHTHRKGEYRSRSAKTPFMHDMWSYDARVPEERPLQEHIDALWQDIEHATEYLRSLKAKATVDVFLGYRSDWMDGGIDVPHESLVMFTKLEVPFTLSIVRL